MRNELIKARNALKLTQKQLANKIGIAERMYQHIEAGTRNGSIEVWIRLSEILNADIKKLYTN